MFAMLYAKYQNRIKLLIVILFSFVGTIDLSAPKEFLQLSKNSNVEIEEFDSFIEKGNLVIYWETVDAENIFQFEIERKCFGSANWELRDNIVALGTSNFPEHYSFLEEEPIIGTSFYRLKIIDIDGSFEYSKQITVEYDEQITDVNYEYSLSQNNPNPFNPSTEITYSLPSKSNVKLSVYSITGEFVLNLESGIRDLGNHSLTWDAAKYSSGIYILTIWAKSVEDGTKFVNSRKLVLVK